MKLGKFTIESVLDATYRLDGGAMYGVVPKVFWKKAAPADAKNRIRLACNVMIVKTDDGVVMVDTGIGEKWDEKQTAIYAIKRKRSMEANLKRIGLTPASIDAVIPSHLHFDHNGGSCIRNADAEIVPAFPNASYYIQKGEWHDAVHPHDRNRASYIQENHVPLMDAGQVRLIEGDAELFPGISVRVTGGHTQHHQIIIVESEGKKIIFWGDVIPTIGHIHAPYITSYDLYPQRTLEIKKELIPKSMEEGALSFWAHDPRHAITGLRRLDSGRITYAPPVAAQNK